MQIPIFRIGGHDENLNIYSVTQILTKIKILSNKTLKKTKYFISLYLHLMSPQTNIREPRSREKDGQMQTIIFTQDCLFIVLN